MEADSLDVNLAFLEDFGKVFFTNLSLSFICKWGVFISYGCSSRRLETTGIYYLTVLEVRRLKPVSLGQSQDVGRALLHLKTLG